MGRRRSSSTPGCRPPPGPRPSPRWTGSCSPAARTSIPAATGDRASRPTRSTEDRDALEAEAWAAAAERALPVVGVCRGLQAINVFSGGTLIQHLDGHSGPAWGRGPAATHPLRVEPGTRLARILFPTNVRGGVVEVNSYHHQAVGPADLAPGLVPNARAASRAGELIEGLETRDGRFVLGVQCHPERTESTPKAFERLFAFFVDAARGPAAAAEPAGPTAGPRR